MTLQIHAVAEIDSSDLRSLVVDNLGSLLGEGARLIENMPPIEGCCLATLDTHDAPVLISFDAIDPQQALLNGLACMDQLGNEIVARFLQDYHPPKGLLVLAPAAPPGQILFTGSCSISWRRIQVLSVNGEFGMVISPADEEEGAAVPIRLEGQPAIVESVLNQEEEQHFSNL